STTLTAIPNQASLRLTWEAFPAVTYKVYFSERSAKGEMVNYPFNRLPTSPNGGTFTGIGEATIQGLLQGRDYCVFVTANYPDNTMDAPNGTKWTGALDNLILGSGNSFAGSIVAGSQKCQRTFANEAFGQVVTDSRIYSLKAHPSNEPTFLAIAKGDAPLSPENDGDNAIPANATSAKVTVYRIDESSGVGIEVGTSIGSGKIKPINPIPPGRYKFFAILEEMRPNLGTTPAAQARKDLVVGTAGNGAEMDSWIYVRGAGASPVDLGAYPEHQQGGAGSLRIGQSVAMGDFNCDGKSDLAVGIPDVIEVPAGSNPPRPSKLGRVMIYYDVTQAPDSRINPSRIQTIKFDTSQISSATRDLQLGTKLQVGNFNGDNQARSLAPSGVSDGLQEKFSCDDLVIGSGAGLVFVLYGRRDNANGPGIPGGLVYNGQNSFATNPSPPCQANNQSCGGPSLYRYEVVGGGVLKLGSAFTVGDFDGDGYQDLAVGSTSTTGIWVLRGGETGLNLPKKYDSDLASASNAEVVNPFEISCQSCFPYIPAKLGDFSIPTFAPAAGDGWASGGEFAVSLGIYRNGYYDPKTKRIRDVLLVGNSTHALSSGRTGRVFGCIPKTATSSTTNFQADPAIDLQWDCNHFIDPPLQYQTQATLPRTNLSSSPVGTPRGFGWAIASFDNPLRYSPSDMQEGSGCRLINGGVTIPAPIDFANCPNSAGTEPIGTKLGFPGGFAISSMRSNSAFFYFGVNSPYTPSQSDRDGFGAARNQDLLNRIFATPDGSANDPVVAIEQVPCSHSAQVESCRVQLIRQSSPGGNFGYNLASIRGSNVYDPFDKPKTALLAVSAPYKSLLQGSILYSNVGQVLLISQDTVSSTSPITVAGNRRFARGFLSSGITLDYDRFNSADPNTVVAGARFGMGGIAGGSVEVGNQGEYNTFTDVVVGAPGHKRAVDVNGTSRLVNDNGSAMLFFSNGTSFLSRRLSDSASPSAWHSIDQVYEPNGVSVGQESDLKFYQAVSIGDIDQDGIDDLVTRISSGGSRNVSRILYGASCSSPLGSGCSQRFKLKPDGKVKYTDFRVNGDDSAGMRFIPVGSIGNNSRGAFFITGENASYLFFSDVNSGITFGDPTFNGSPRKFARPTVSSSGFSYLDFSDDQYFNPDGTTIQSNFRSLNSFASGDFNGDGRMDFAFSQDLNAEIQDTRLAATCPTVNGNRSCLSFSSGKGRVFVWYGGAGNGPAVQPDGSSGYPLVTEYSGLGGGSEKFGMATLSSLASHTSGAPCGSSGGMTCNRIQVIGEEGTTSFGQSIASIPVGSCGSNPVSALAVRALNSAGNQSRIFVYLPKCSQPDSSLDYSGLVATGLMIKTETDSIPPTNGVVLSGIGASNGFGMSMVGTGITGLRKIMKPTSSAAGSLLGHLIATDSSLGRVGVFPLVRNGAGSVLFEPLPPDLSVFDPNLNFYKMGGRLNHYSSLGFLAPQSPSDARFGLNSAYLGDLNADGYADIGINIASMHRKENSATFDYQGAVLTLFGGEKGLQTHRETTGLLITPKKDADASCYLVKKSGSSPISVCDPQLLFAPQPSLVNSPAQGAYEYMYLNQFSHLSTGANSQTGTCSISDSRNECIGSFLYGVPGRDSPSTSNNLSRILQGGAFYVQP
ncbi:MAG: FG-GAP repeat protein, partial [Bdellovibrionales bacterium]|nr:FG-GAP repeat protein [Bdellovibrionales bacterium]